MSSIEIVIIIVGMTLITVLTRTLFMILGDRVELPDIILRAIRYAPLAAIIAIVAPEIILPPGANALSQFDWHSANIWGGLAGFITYYFSRKMVPTMLVGMAVFSLVRYWL